MKFYDEDFKSPFGDRIAELSARLVRAQYQLIERHLIGAIEQIEGRVPTNAEVVEHGRRLRHPDGSETWTWRGKPILAVPRDAFKLVDGKAVFEIQSVFKPEE